MILISNNITGTCIANNIYMLFRPINYHSGALAYAAIYDSIPILHLIHHTSSLLLSVSDQGTRCSNCIDRCTNRRNCTNNF